MGVVFYHLRRSSYSPAYGSKILLFGRVKDVKIAIVFSKSGLWTDSYLWFWKSNIDAEFWDLVVRSPSEYRRKIQLPQEVLRRVEKLATPLNISNHVNIVWAILEDVPKNTAIDYLNG